MCHKCDVNEKRNKYNMNWFLKVHDHIVKNDFLIYKLVGTHKVQHFRIPEPLFNSRGKSNLRCGIKGTCFIPGLHKEIDEF